MEASKKKLYLKYLVVVLMAVQFSFDSCVYLSSVVNYIKSVSIMVLENN